MLHQTFLFLGELWQLFEVSQILEFYGTYIPEPKNQTNDWANTDLVHTAVVETKMIQQLYHISRILEKWLFDYNSHIIFLML